MSERINQLCKNIAANPAKINLVTEAIKMALTAGKTECFVPIVELLKSLDQNQEIIKFRDNKLMVIFAHLNQICLK
jgi:hypothetical protein